MAAIGARYLVDAQGRKTAVVINIKEYERLMRRLEDLEDALELDQAVKTASEFRDYRDIREELSREGRL